jgi:hypothetical protein
MQFRAPTAQAPMLHPDTAPSYRSIWSGVNQSEFRDRVKVLEAQNIVGNLSTSNSQDLDSHDPRYLLPLASEQRLADDIAFLAAYEPGAGYVSAATFGALEGQPGIRICLAANRGVTEAAEAELRKFLALVEQCARKGSLSTANLTLVMLTGVQLEITRDKFREDVFDLAIRFNKNRVLGRLCSKWGTRYHKALLSTRWLKVLNSHRPLVPAETSEDFEVFFTDMNDLHALVLQLEQSEQEGENIPLLKHIARNVHRMTWEGVPLLLRLNTFGFPESIFEKRDVRELLKLANYWRLCCNLEVHCRSRKYQSHFQTIDLQIVEPYFISKDPNTQEERFIHAEIQLIVHHENSNQAVWPRAIGGSKEACFLCDAFIRAHGFFRVTKSHGCTFWKWTVPDLEEYTQATLSRFRATLAGVELEVQTEYERAQHCQRQPAHPLQSSINLHEPPPLTPKASTVFSITSGSTKPTSKEHGFMAQCVSKLRLCGCGIV